MAGHWVMDVLQNPVSQKHPFVDMNEVYPPTPNPQQHLHACHSTTGKCADTKERPAAFESLDETILNQRIRHLRPLEYRNCQLPPKNA